MKFLAMLILNVMLAFCFKVHSQLLNKSINISVEQEILSTLNEFESHQLSQKIQSIRFFLQEKVEPLIPMGLKQSLRNQKVSLHIHRRLKRDGLTQNAHEQYTSQISIHYSTLNSSGLMALIAHEFFHTLHFSLSSDEYAWVKEGLAQVFEFLVTGQMNWVNLNAAMMNPFTKLIDTYQIEKSNEALYGHSQLYFLYLYERCGKEKLFWKLVEGIKGYKGSRLIDKVLESMNLPELECKNFDESVIHFEVAKMHNKIQYSKPELEQRRFFISPSNITPNIQVFSSKESLSQFIESMPVLSSAKIPLSQFLSFDGQCEKCIIFYAHTKFPFNVTEDLSKILNEGKVQDYVAIPVKIND